MEAVFIDHRQPIPTNNEACVLALGVFDGVHVGHQEVIRVAKEIAKSNHIKLAVMTFEPYPNEVLQKKNKNPTCRLMSLDAKRNFMSALGVDRLYIMKFDLDFAKFADVDFVQKYIVPLGAVHVVAGFDFRYGYRGTGHMGTIQAHGMNKFGVTTVEQVSHGCEKISSTLIRESLLQGDVEFVATCLGRFYETEGRVVNLSPPHSSVSFLDILTSGCSLPPEGFYDVCVYLDEKEKIHRTPAYLFVNEQGEPLVVIHARIRGKVKVRWIRRMSEVRENSRKNQYALG